MTSEDRLNRIETILGTLIDAVQTLNQTVGSASHLRTNAVALNAQTPLCRPDFDMPPLETAEILETGSFRQREESSHTLPSFFQASLDLESVVSRISSVPESLDGPASLRELSHALGAMNFEDKVREDVRKAGRAENLFYVPNRDEENILMDGT